MKKVKAAFRGIVIFLLCVIEIYPLFWMLTASFKKQAEWSEKPAYALNDGFYFQNYSDAWTRGHMSTFFKNSLITTLVALVFIVFFSVTVGFAVTKMKWKFRNAVAQYFRFGIMIPVAIALIPLFQIFSKTIHVLMNKVTWVPQHRHGLFDSRKRSDPVAVEKRFAIGRRRIVRVRTARRHERRCHNFPAANDARCLTQDQFAQLREARLARNDSSIHEQMRKF